MIKDNQYINSPYFWDYKIKKTDLKKPAVKKFWLERKVNFCDFKDIKKKDLKKFLSVLDIRPDLENMLTIFLANENK